MSLAAHEITVHNCAEAMHSLIRTFVHPSSFRFDVTPPAPVGLDDSTHPTNARRRAPRRLAALSVCLFALIALFTAGCEAHTQKYLEPRDIGDKVTEDDLEAFLQVVNDLPDKKLPEMPVLFKKPPSWDEQRTLPVNELVREETDELDKLWNDENLIRHLQKDRNLQKALRQRLTLAQFVGLVKTIGAALTRNAVRPDQNLHKIVEQGKKRLESLHGQTRRFNQLKPDERHVVLTTAVWITRMDRARRLLQVPPENRAMAKNRLERLQTIFPQEFTANPFDSIADQIDELGMSFEELRQTGLDAEIDWKENEALRGSDRPDAEVGESTADAGTKHAAP
jgi:hypothetical protein